MTQKGIFNWHPTPNHKQQEPHTIHEHESPLTFRTAITKTSTVHSTITQHTVQLTGDWNCTTAMQK